MTRRAAMISQPDIARIVRAAKQAGAAEVVIPMPTGNVVIRLSAQSSTVDEHPLAQNGEIIL